MKDLSDIDVKAIIQGHWNVLFPQEEIEEIAAERMKECLSCEFYGETKCLKCGCPLRAKTRSLRSKCPADKWGAVILYTKK